MIKQVVLILLLSLAAIFFKSQLSHILDGVISLHNVVAHTLHIIFSDDDVGRLIQDIIALLLIPLVSGGSVAVGFWFVKREAMPQLMSVIWIVWLVLLTTMVAQSGMISMANVSKQHDVNQK